MRHIDRKYPKPLTPEQAEGLDLTQLPRSSRPRRTVKHRPEQHAARVEALAVLGHPTAYTLFADVPLNRARGSFPAALYSALETLLVVGITVPGVLRLLKDDPAVLRALARGLAAHGLPGDAQVLARQGLPSEASWHNFLTQVEAVTGDRALPVREAFRLNALAVALSLGHLNPAGARHRLTDPDPRTFVTCDGTVLKSPTDNTDEIVLDTSTGQARTKRVDPSRRRHHEGGQAEEGSGVAVDGTKFITIHTHGSQWRDFVTLDIAHDSDTRPGRRPGEPGAGSEAALGIEMLYRLLDRSPLDPSGQPYTDPDGEPVTPFVAGLVYDKALRGTHAEELAKRDLIAVSRITRAPGSTHENPIYRQLPVKTVPCENAPSATPGLPGHTHTLVASRGRVWERTVAEDGSVILTEPLNQKVERRPRVNAPTVWYRRVTIECPFGQPHSTLISILEPAAPPREPDLDHLPSRAQEPPRRTRGRRQQAQESEVSRGEYLRIFAEGEDPFHAVHTQRPAAENRNSVLDAALPDKRIPAYGPFRQMVWMIGFYNGSNILSHHYVTAHAVPGYCGSQYHADDEIVIVLNSPAAHPAPARRARCLSGHAPSRPATSRPLPVRPRGGRPPNRR